MSTRALRVSMAGIFLALLVLLLGLWVDAKGQIRGIHWLPPEALALDTSELVMQLSPQSIDQSSLLQTLERPLFSPARRPPPPPPPPETVAGAGQPSELGAVHLYGLYGGGNRSGAIVRVDGKNQRLALHESIRGWVLEAIGDSSITLRRGGRQQTIELVHVIPVAEKAEAGAAMKRPLSRGNAARSRSAGDVPAPTAPAPQLPPAVGAAPERQAVSPQAQATPAPTGKTNAAPRYSTGPGAFQKKQTPSR